MERNDQLILIIGVILLVTLGAVIYYAKLQTPETVLYHEGPGGTYRIDIVRHGTSIDYYVHPIVDGKQYTVQLPESPASVQNVTLSPAVLAALERPRGIETVYVTQDLSLANKTQSDSDVALFQLAKVLGQAEFSVFKLNYRSAFTTSNNRTIELNLPVVTCANVTDDVAVIQLQLGAETQVAEQNDCILIQGPNGHELLRATSTFIYHILGVL